MKVTFMLFGNFGDPRHGKGMVGYYTVKKLFEEGMLSRIIAKDYAKTDIPSRYIKKAVLGGDIYHLGLRGIEEYLFHSFPSRIVSEKIFDLLGRR